MYNYIKTTYVEEKNLSKKYKDLKDYFEDKYYEQLTTICRKYVIRNKKDFSSKYIPEPTSVKYQEFTIRSVHFTNCEETDLIKFVLYVIITAEIKGRAGNFNQRNYDVDSADCWVSLHYQARLDNGLRNVKFLEIEEFQKQKYDSLNTLSKYLIPYFHTEDLDNRAENFLKKYYPEALMKPMPIQVYEISRKMNLTVRYAPLEGTVFGRTYFANSEEIIYNDEWEPVKEKISKGTILINRDTTFMQSLGGENNTIIHECVHWEFHKKFFELQHILNPEIKNTFCETVDYFLKGGILSEEFEWMEWQANALALRILLPSKTTKQKFDLVLKSLMDHFPNKKSTEIYELALNQVADFFHVTLSALKVRLIQLGYKGIIGINNYIDNQRKESYFVNKKSIEFGQTYRIDFIDSVIASVFNPKLKSLIDQNKIVYADGFYSLNDPKYVKVDQNGKVVLTDYALEHVDECCLVFDVKGNFKSNFDKTFYSLCYLCRDASSNNISTYLNFNVSQNQKILSIAEDMRLVQQENEDSEEMLKLMDGTFADVFSKIIEYKGYVSNTSVANLIRVSEGTIRNYLNGSSHPNLKTVVAICGGLCLPPDVSYALIAKAGYKLGSRGVYIDYIYIHLIRCCYREGLEKWNERLRIVDSNECLP